MQPHQSFINVNNVRIHYFTWGNPKGETILLLHATSFHARVWDQVVKDLDHEKYHIIAMEHRGHGRSEKVAPYKWQNFGDDVVAFVEAMDLRDVVCVGHSMGGYCAVYVTIHRPDTFQSLLLLDPVIMTPETYGSTNRAITSYADPSEHPVSRRRNEWDSAEHMFNHFANRNPYSLWDPTVLRDYCTHGIEAAGSTDEGNITHYILRCPPLVEASIYMGNSGYDITDHLATVKIPVQVLRAAGRREEGPRMDFSKSPTWPELASQFPNGTDEQFEELSHYIPMQAPAYVAERISLLRG